MLALVAGQGLSQTPLRIYTIAGTLTAITCTLWERFTWKWKIVRYFTGVPLIAGTWRGEIFSSHTLFDGSSLPPIRAALHVSQSASSVTATLFTGESKSVTEHAKLAKDPDGRWRLTWQYVNMPRPGVRERSERHRGACEVYVGSQPGEGLEGSYFTDRRTDGEIHFTEWSPNRYGNAESAFGSDGFIAARPYVGST
ncbi:hypothetical protein ACFV0R_29150 [Streptomyces sp. NPDC059578]|uniref:Cap15 family cyclic dinucleotide receptor domain-containing protein n=1 Tax=Streptomyces sp. NPDC059578 TaxID=3346874 RepID=UPI0036ADE162